MPFYVHAEDRPGVGPRLLDLAEEHWSYMDEFDDRLVLRGPTLSADGEEHTGSVHVVDLDDRAAAERFAAEEPFWRAGLYGHLTTDRVVVLLDGRPGRGAYLSEGPYALVTGRWPVVRGEAGLPGGEPDGRLRFVAALVDDDRTGTTGIVAVAPGAPEAARAVVQPVADLLAGAPVTLTAQRWQRGGRS
ncbi:hypothetical protein HII36_23300 [Nonomuraea sp. NN258]|uniref:YciI family protein n=1 Tax=Nonomuraea antri TaxID=2730852 RepID=UPI0015685241|nr:YciI family protein [Nonomuraea antri]NRQ34736.1 hypothetical protein [Nonomuraea antri]